MWSTDSYSNAVIINQYFEPTQIDSSNLKN